VIADLATHPALHLPMRQTTIRDLNPPGPRRRIHLADQGAGLTDPNTLAALRATCVCKTHLRKAAVATRQNLDGTHVDASITSRATVGEHR
jgi:hypothetical protein